MESVFYFQTENKKSMINHIEMNGNINNDYLRTYENNHQSLKWLYYVKEI